MSKNKIKYNLKNVHVAKCTKVTDAVTGEVSYSYDTPISLPGAVNLSLSAEGESSPFYADGIVYYRADNNNGYSGDLEIALVPDWFRTLILKERKDENGVLVEKSDLTEAVPFALLFEFDGDQKCIRHVMYNCTVSTRPAVSSQTKEDSIAPVTESLSLSADPRADGLVKSKTSDDVKSDTYAGWYDSVYIPDPENWVTEYASLSALTIGALTLNPTFASGTTVYTADTANASDLITATPASGVTVQVKVNGTIIQNGTAPDWRSGANTVTVTCSKDGAENRVYTVTVTYTPATQG